MAHRRGTFRGRGGISEAQRRKKTWLSFGTVGSECVGVSLQPPDIGVAPGSSVIVSGITSANAASAGFLEGTIMRIRGSVLVPKSTTTPGTGNVAIAFGIGFITDEAFAVSAVPNPATAAGADWDGWMFYRTNLAAPLDANAAVMDSKAMRKWQGGTTLAIIAGACVDAGSSVGIIGDVQLSVRALILLP